MSSSPYNALYRATESLWGMRPGRLLPSLVKLRSGGTAYDLGAGEGRNAAFLAANGWKVFAVDTDPIATCRLEAMTRKLALHSSITVHRGDALRFVETSDTTPNLVLLYGLPHCLNDRPLKDLLRWCRYSTPRGTILAGSALTAELGVPHDHGTGPLYMRTVSMYRSELADFEMLSFEVGEIRENHAPLVGDHHHSAIWFICRNGQ